MVGRLERTKNYLISLAERSTGIAAAREWYHDNDNRSLTGAIAAGLQQAAIPLMYRSAMDELNGIRVDRKHTKPYEYTVSWLAGFGAGSLLDVSSGFATVLLLPDHPVEAIAFKLAANVASNVAGDIAERAVYRIRNFRLPVIPLAI